MIIEIITLSIVGLVGIYVWRKEQENKQLEYIRDYTFSSALVKRVQEKHDYLSDSDIKQVIKALRDYFHICNQAKGKIVAMPSEIVDVAWHEFILFTREYQQFCEKGIGRFLHHTPTEAMKTKTSAQEGIKRAWRLACAKEHINPKDPKKLPLIFEIDALLNIKGGFKYTRNCKSHLSSNSDYCATHIGCTSGCSGDSGDSSSNDSSCGGGGCGGD